MTTPPPGGYPPPSGYPNPFAQLDAKRRNTVGLVALIVAVLGLIAAPFVLLVSAVLLPVALVLGVVGLCLPGRPKATSAGAVVVAVIGAVVSGFALMDLVRGVFDDAFDSAEPPSPTESVSASEGPGAGAPPGSRENPLLIGETVTEPGWTVTLGAPREAAAEVAAADPSNPAPSPGMEFWIVPVRATYTGDDPVRPALEIWVEFVGSDSRTYGDECGFIPDSLLGFGELHTGEVAEANTCVAVPADADGLWALTIAMFSDPVFFATE